MAGETLGELALVGVNEETLEDIGNKVEDVTRRISFLRFAVVPLFFISWGIYFLWLN